MIFHEVFKTIGIGISLISLFVLAIWLYRKTADRKPATMPTDYGGDEPIGSAAMGLWLVAVGGLVAILGTLLPWVDVRFGPLHSSVKVFGTPTGLFVLVLGGVLLARGVIGARGPYGAHIGVSIVGLIVGGILAFITLKMMLSFRTEGIRVILMRAPDLVAPGHPGQTDQVQALLQQWVDQGILKLSMGIGIYLTTAGGLLSIVGGFWNISHRVPSAAASQVHASGPLPSWGPGGVPATWDPFAPAAAATPPAGGFSYGSGPKPAEAPAGGFSYGSGPKLAEALSVSSGPPPAPSRPVPSTHPAPVPPPPIAVGVGPPAPPPLRPPAPQPSTRGGFDLGDSWSAGPTGERRRRAGHEGKGGKA